MQPYAFLGMRYMKVKERERSFLVEWNINVSGLQNFLLISGHLGNVGVFTKNLPEMQLLQSHNCSYFTTFHSTLNSTSEQHANVVPEQASNKFNFNFMNYHNFNPCF